MRALGLTAPDGFFQFLFSVAANLRMYLSKAEVKSNLIGCRNPWFDFIAQTFFYINGFVRLNACFAGLTPTYRNSVDPTAKNSAEAKNFLFPILYLSVVSNVPNIS